MFDLELSSSSSDDDNDDDEKDADDDVRREDNAGDNDDDEKNQHNDNGNGRDDYCNLKRAAKPSLSTVNATTTATTRTTRTSSPHRTALSSRLQTAIRKLWRAHEILQDELGISLVVPIEESNQTSPGKAKNPVETSTTADVLCATHGVQPLDITSDGDSSDDEGATFLFQPETQQERRPQIQKDDPSVSPKQSFRQRSDQAVLADILQTIKSWTKLKLNTRQTAASKETAIATEHERYACFMPPNWLPCFVAPTTGMTTLDKDIAGILPSSNQSLRRRINHPAVLGVDCLVEALSYIDIFGPALSEIFDRARSQSTVVDGGNIEIVARMLVDYLHGDGFHGQSLHEDQSLNMARVFLIGMNNRHEMVRRFVTSLQGEICQDWAFHDRHARVVASSLHYQDNDVTSAPETSTDPSNDPTDADDMVQKDGSNDFSNGVVHFDPKNATRLSTLAERCILVRIVASLHARRQDASAALEFLFEYFISAVPALGIEDYPKYPPVLSICIVEAILTTRLPTGRILIDVWAEKVEMHVFQTALAFTAAIFGVRSRSIDSRISEVATVEGAAWNRVRLQIEKRDKNATNNFAPSIVRQRGFLKDSFSKSLKRLLDQTLEIYNQGDPNLFKAATSTVRTLHLVLTMQGDVSQLRSIFSSWTDRFINAMSYQNVLVLLACAKACRQMEIRRIGEYQESILSTWTTKASTVSEDLSSNLIDGFLRFAAASDDNVSGKMEMQPELISSILLSICQELSDGESAIRFGEWNLSSSVSFASGATKPPTVRVINLQRRKDRMAQFMAQAMHSDIMVVKAVLSPKHWQGVSHDIAHFPRANDLIGTYAVDESLSSPVSVTHSLKDFIANAGPNELDLDSLVAPQWRPSDIAAFDAFATDDQNRLVSLSQSEKACAMSHIAAWRGVASSLPCAPSSASYGGLLQWTWTGVARGDPHFASDPSHAISPAPVVLILEDDAILVDRFVDRLEDLLQELPRDFHYCAIGYARPKTAPLVDLTPPCKHIKLPTMTWYLTGYLLSGAGARYLLKHLPVVGPVDTWLGRKMILGQNWENVYGSRVGVGNNPRSGKGAVSTVPAVSRKEMQTCMRFRAYCASAPLCHQKVGGAANDGANQCHWRHRDTDIVYSGK